MVWRYVENARPWTPALLEVNELDDLFVAADRKLPRPLALLEKVEWDTLMFFYGVLMAVGGLGAMGYLALTSQVLYGVLGPTVANILLGLLSAVIDNVPVTFAVLQMSPDMSQGQWLLVTLTAGVGGSRVSIGSAAGVTLMGQARGIYTFSARLRWIWALALGYVASVATHFWLNARPPESLDSKGAPGARPSIAAQHEQGDDNLEDTEAALVCRIPDRRRSGQHTG